LVKDFEIVSASALLISTGSAKTDHEQSIKIAKIFFIISSVN
jgi:hypothetical protein